jgi:anti-sigma regulatory factor (Ser/Thr protein kinase)
MHVHRFLHTPLHLHDVKSKIANTWPSSDRPPWGFAMIVDQADETTDAPARDGRRHWSLSTLGQAGRPAGRWPTPPAGTSPRSARRLLTQDAESSKAARDFTRVTLHDWDLEPLADDVSVVVSELVTNALRHGMNGFAQPAGHVSPIQLVLFGHQHRLVVVVSDPGDQRPVLTEIEPSRFAESGRGLVVVEAMSTSWGWAPLATGGKAVWSAFDLSPLPRPVPKLPGPLAPAPTSPAPVPAAPVH